MIRIEMPDPIDWGGFANRTKHVSEIVKVLDVATGLEVALVEEVSVRVDYPHHDLYNVRTGMWNKVPTRQSEFVELTIRCRPTHPLMAEQFQQPKTLTKE